MARVIRLLAVLCLLCRVPQSAAAMTVSSDAPGNVFVAGKAIRIEVKDAQGEVTYELTDYFGTKKAGGTASTTVLLLGQEPGWYELTCKDASGSASTSIGVVVDRGSDPLPEDGRVCVDVAAAWLVSKDAPKPVARMVRMAGIPWVRERLSWAGTEEPRGKLDWAQYPAVADAFAAEGVRICQMWHNCPSWSRSDGRKTSCPDDLRDMYNFSRAAAARFSRQIQAWEVWNEVDASFWPELSDRYSGLLKAAYLGLKDGNPRALAIHSSLCAVGAQFQDDLYESGGGDYFDIFNWHVYGAPSIYPSTLKSYLAPLNKHGISDRPIWLTEAGIRLLGTEGPDKHLLNWHNQRRQCRFVPRSAAMSLAAGTDRNFYFVLPSYDEAGRQFGALRPDLTPNPSFVALSAAANIIGQSEYKGHFDAGNGIEAELFSTPGGNVLVVWSETESEIAVPTEKTSLRVANIFGARSDLAVANGIARIGVGPDAVYLLDVGKSVETKLIGKPHPRGKLPVLNPSRVIVVGHANQPVDKASNCYSLSGQDAFDYVVDVYNFSEKAGRSGKIELVAADGWRVENATREIKLGAMDRQVLTYRVTPAKPGVGRFKLTARAGFAGSQVAPCISAFRFNPAIFRPATRRALDWAADCARWNPRAAPTGKVSLSAPESGTLRIDARFTSTGDRWAYPTLRFDKPIDLSEFDGVAFELNVSIGDPDSFIRLMLVEPNGAHYMATTSASEGKRRVAFLFKDMWLLDIMGPDPNGQLDLDAISAVSLGCNTKRDHIAFDISGFELVTF